MSILSADSKYKNFIEVLSEKTQISFCSLVFRILKLLSEEIYVFSMLLLLLRITLSIRSDKNNDAVES